MEKSTYSSEQDQFVKREEVRLAGAVSDRSAFLSVDRAEPRKMNTKKGEGEVAPNQSDNDEVTMA